MIINYTNGIVTKTVENEKYIISANINAGEINIPLELQLTKSPVMEEWLMAYPPFLYKSSIKNAIVIANSVVCDIEDNEIYNIHNKAIRSSLNSEVFGKVMRHLSIPTFGLKDFNTVLEKQNIENVADINLSSIKEALADLPTALDVAKWRFMPISDALVNFELAKFTPLFARISGEAVPSLKYMKWIMSEEYKRNIQWISSEFKKEIIKRKVKMPLQAPGHFINNNNVLVFTSTPQSEKAGEIASLALGVELNECGEVIKRPSRALSLTTIQNPFPQKMGPIREIIMGAIDQAVSLANPEPPLVIYQN